MKRLSISLTYREKDGQLKSYDTVEGDTLIEVTAKFIQVIAQVSDAIKREEINELRQSIDDDIPF